MATVYFTSADINAGTTITKILDTGSYCAIKFSNMSPYPLVTHTQQSYNHDTYFSDMLDIIQPWTITAVHVQEYPVVCYITMDTGFAPVNTTDATLLSMQGVTGRSYQSPLPSYTPIDLLARTQTNITNASIPVSGSVDANITNATIDANSTIVNELLSVGPSVCVSETLASTTYNSGTLYVLGIPIPKGIYDGTVLYIQSPGGFIPNFNNSSLVVRNIIDSSAGSLSTSLLTQPLTNITTNGNIGLSGICLPFSLIQAGNIIQIQFNPTSTFTDELIVTAFLRYASSTVDNASDNPANVQPVFGSPVASGDTTLPANQTSALSIIPSGGVLQKLIITCFNNNNGTMPNNAWIAIYNGSEEIAGISVANLPVGTTSDSNPQFPPLVIDFSPGVTNNGISAWLLNSPSYSGGIEVYAVL